MSERENGLFRADAAAEALWRQNLRPRHAFVVKSICILHITFTMNR